MNASAFRALGCAAWLVLTGAHARDWTDSLPSGFSDPLLTRPPVLESGALLPGDDAPLSCPPPTPPESHPMALHEVVDVALCQNPQVQTAWAAIKVQAAQLGQARAAYLPQVTAGISRQEQRVRYPESQFTVQSDVKGNNQYASLTWRLLDFGGRDASRRSADALLAAALAGHDATIQRILGVVIGAYFDVQTARAAREAKERSQVIAAQTLQAVVRRQARGLSDQSGVLQAQTAQAKADLDASRARGVEDKAVVALKLAMGAPLRAAPGVVLAEVGTDDTAVTEGDLQAWLDSASEQHPALVAARAQLRAARERATVARSEGLPTLDFSRNEYVNGRPNQSLSASRSRESTTAFGITVPLFDGFGKTYKLREAQAQIESKAGELREAELQVLGDIVKAHADAKAALGNLDASRRLLDAARLALESIERKYERGISDTLELLATQAALADAEQERIRVLSEWRSAQLRILASAGTLGRQRLRAD